LQQRCPEKTRFLASTPYFPLWSAHYKFQRREKSGFFLKKTALPSNQFGYEISGLEEPGGQKKVKIFAVGAALGAFQPVIKPHGVSSLLKVNQGISSQ